MYIKIRDQLDDCILREAIKETPPKPYNTTRFTIKITFEEETTSYQTNNMGQLMPIPGTRSVIKHIQVINPDTDNCNSWAIRVLEKYDELIEKKKMNSLLFTISGYFLVITFIICASVYPITLDTDSWYDWISRIALITSLILNILCFISSIFYIIKHRKVTINIIACILSITFMIITYKLISIEQIVIK